MSRAHAVTGLSPSVLTGLGLAALAYRAERRIAVIEPDSLATVFGYLAGVWLPFAQRGG